MKITQVERQTKNPKRFNIFLDGQFGFGADEDTVVNERLIVGKELSQTDLDRVLFEAEVGVLMDRMYGLFAIRQRSESELREYVRRKNYESRIKGKQETSDLVLENLIERLKKRGLINDLEFAKNWVESRRKSKLKGEIAIKAELYKKGIDREIIEEVVRVQGTGYSEEELAKTALSKRVERWKNLPIQEFKKKSLEYLMRQGFSYSICKDVVESFAKKRYNSEDINESFDLDDS